jgi:thiosulfate/3-mercaptopyruvate sulfurtransferase
MTRVLVSATDLARELAGPTPPRLLDVRWALGDPHGRDHYREGHLPGAVFVDLDTELADPRTIATEGRHPLPSMVRLQRAARGWGLRSGEPVVVYDNDSGRAAARAWWLLRWAGVADVRLLDGGLAAWSGPLESGENHPENGDVELSPGHLPVLNADEAARLPAAGGVLLDARAGERYRGEVEPVDPRAGHIPGAVSAPTSENLAPDGTFRSDLAEHYATLGVGKNTTVGVYCGSGVTAAHDIAALAVIGIRSALYPGSWSAWSNNPSRPVAVGPTPDGRPLQEVRS